MAEFSTAPVRRADTPELCAGGLGDPSCRCSCGSACLHDYTVLRVLPKYAVAVDCQAVRSSLDAGQRDGTVGANVAPILIRLCVKVVVLEIESIASKDGDSVGDASWESDLTCPSATTGGLNITRNVLSN